MSGKGVFAMGNTSIFLANGIGIARVAEAIRAAFEASGDSIFLGTTWILCGRGCGA